MIYIRTAIDTIEMLIYEDTDGIITEKYDEFGNKVASKMKSSWIKKRADNIEELCDTTVKIFDDGFTIVGDDITTKTGHCVLYGAVWTNRGLIYVAKINENGELELFHEIY